MKRNVKCHSDKIFNYKNYSVNEKKKIKDLNKKKKKIRKKLPRGANSLKRRTSLRTRVLEISRPVRNTFFHFFFFFSFFSNDDSISRDTRFIDKLRETRRAGRKLRGDRELDRRTGLRFLCCLRKRIDTWNAADRYNRAAGDIVK